MKKLVTKMHTNILLTMRVSIVGKAKLTALGTVKG